jgi:hypothetical protein
MNRGDLLVAGQSSDKYISSHHDMLISV